MTTQGATIIYMTPRLNASLPGVTALYVQPQKENESCTHPSKFERAIDERVVPAVNNKANVTQKICLSDFSDIPGFVKSYTTETKMTMVMLDRGTSKKQIRMLEQNIIDAGVRENVFFVGIGKNRLTATQKIPMISWWNLAGLKAINRDELLAVREKPLWDRALDLFAHIPYVRYYL